jgi:quercetin dioxygenase-like cupin family protein
MVIGTASRRNEKIGPETPFTHQEGPEMTNSRAKAVPTVQIENDRVIVTEWRFPPGAETGWHRHGHDYVVVPRTTGTLLLEEHGGNRVAPLTAGISYFRNVGVEHNVVNANDFEFVFVEVEIKKP